MPSANATNFWKDGVLSLLAGMASIADTSLFILVVGQV